MLILQELPLVPKFVQAVPARGDSLNVPRSVSLLPRRTAVGDQQRVSVNYAPYAREVPPCARPSSSPMAPWNSPMNRPVSPYIHCRQSALGGEPSKLQRDHVPPAAHPTLTDVHPIEDRHPSADRARNRGVELVLVGGSPSAPRYRVATLFPL